MKLLVATHNEGKVAEMTAMLADAGIECLSLDDAGVEFDVEETATTFIGNATLKAQQYAKATGLLTLADDSGLEIDALNGEPGVYTSRYGGAEITQRERMQLVLDKLDGLAGEQRSARFRCTVVLAGGEGEVLESAEGVCEGQIFTTMRGTGGFGYDPIFYLPERQITMAELNLQEKKAISHRGNAMRAIMPAIQKHAIRNTQHS